MPTAGQTEPDKLSLEQSNALLKAISRAQQHLISNVDPHQLFDSLLKDFLELTQSENGFIGEILYQEDGLPYLKTHAISNIAWNDESRAFYQAHAPEGLEFNNLNTLFGRVISSGEALIANDPTNDQRGNGTPKGHPILKTFLGLPVFFGKQHSGMIGVANRPGGYDSSIIDYLKPLLETYAQIINVHQANTARDQLLKQLHASEQKFRSYVENSPDALFLVSRDGKINDVNQATCSSLGYTRAELLSLSVFDISDTASHERIEQAWHSIEDGHPIKFEGVHRHKDGSTFPVDLGFSFHRDETDIYLMAQARDITALKRNEEELREARNKLEEKVKQRTQHLDELNYLLEATFASLSEAVCVVDAESRQIISCNQAVERIFGYSRDEVIGQHIELLHQNHECYEQFKKNLTADLAKATVFHTEFQLKRKNGELFPTENSVTEIKSDSGQRTAFVSVIRDITERRQAEQTIQTQLHHLNAIEHISHLALKSNIDDMLGSVLDEILDIFECDRAWILFPCDPDAPNWHVPMERTRPEWPGIHASGKETPMDPEVAEVFRTALQKNSVVRYDPQSPHALPRMAQEFSIQSQLTMALHLKTGKPWLLGLHHCAEPHLFTDDEVRLFNEIGQRLTEALSVQLTVADLTRSETSLAEAQRIAQLGSWELDLSNNQGVCSDEVCRIFGIQVNERSTYSYQDFLAIVHPDDRDLVKTEYVRSLKNKTPYEVIHRLLLKDRTVKHVHTRCETEYDTNDKPLRLVGTTQDVTTRVLTEQALKVSEERWRSITRYSPDHIMMIDPEGIILFINHTVPDLTAEQVIGTPINSYIPEKFRPHAQACFQRVLDSGKPDRYETEYCDKDGNCRYFEAHVGPIKDQIQVTTLIVSARDITERKKAEIELQQLATVVKNTAEAVIVTNADNQIIAVNCAFTEITGYSEEEALGQSPRLLKSEKHQRDFYGAMWAAIESTGMWQGEIWDRRKNGEIFPAWSTISAVHDSDGNLTNYVSVFSDISSIKRSQEQLDFLAHHDPLTSLPNRVLFYDRLEHALQRAQREDQLVAVFFLDLDRFKNINDSLGHPVGDALLQNAGERITHLVRKEDTVARLGGDEFIILIEEVTEAQDAAQLAQKITEAFFAPFVIDGHELHQTVSIGISLYPQDGEDSNTLVRNADAAMYRAKEDGRNDYQFYTSALTAAVFERLTLETALRRALSRDEFILYYQPQYSLITGGLIGAEALIRWQHPDMGLVGPTRFIPLAEECGLIEPIGEWVLRSACLQMQQWLDSGLILDRIAVNVSGLQFQRHDLLATLKQVLNDSGLNPEHLELEITESYIMQKTESAIKVLDEIKQLGVSISVDDFGTGYSSLSYLKRLPLDKLKIDKSFVRDIPDDPNDEAITRAIVALGQSLQLKVIAEGIETKAQQQFLKAIGCDEGQGYLYGDPLPADEFIKQIKS